MTRPNPRPPIHRLAAVGALCLLCAAPLLAQEPPPQESLGPFEVARAEVEALIQEQTDAWNRGDLEAFCSVYDDLAAFASTSGLTRSRQEVLDRYKARYPDAAAMGKLTLGLLDIRHAATEGPTIEVQGVTVIARWALSYEDREDLEGLTLIVFHRDGEGGWKIVQDASF